jgi:hypothetical protein
MHQRKPDPVMRQPPRPTPGTPLWLRVEILTCTEALIWSTNRWDEHGKVQHIWLMTISDVKDVLENVDRIVDICTEEGYRLRTDDAHQMIVDCLNDGLRILGHTYMEDGE